MKNFKAVIFDLDGTLLNTIDDLSDAVNYMLNEFGYPTHTVEDYKLKVGNGMPKLMERALPIGHKTQEEIDRALSVFMPYYNAHKMDKTAPYEDILKLLTVLKEKNLKIAVVTNKAHSAAVPLVREVFPDVFDCVTGLKDGANAKPAPDSVFETLKTLGVNADESIFVGDSSVDMLTAKNAGCFALGVLWGFRSADELLKNGADRLISKPMELLELL